MKFFDSKDTGSEHLMECLSKRDMEWVQWRAPKKIKGLKHLTYGKAEGAGTVSPGEEKIERG